jgi:nicotinate-nucleotide adenylyltransferase
LNLCIFGGTFDPVHTGHLQVAGEVLRRLAPARIVFVPAGRPWLKTDRPVTSAADRLAMVELVVGEHADMSASTMEIERPGPSYTVDTLLSLKAALPAGDGLYFIVGWDKLEELPRWKEPEKIIKLCRLVAVPRTGTPLPSAAVMERILPGLSRRVVLLEKPEIDISATVIRQRVRLGLPVDKMVPRAVETYIREHGLYLEQ